MFKRLFGSREKSAPPAVDAMLGWSVDRHGTQAIKSGSMPVLAGRGTAKINPTDFGLSTAFAINETAFRAASLRAKKIDQMPFMVVDRKTLVPILNHPLIGAMDFSRRYYRRPLFESWELGWCIHGEVYMEKVRDQYDQIVAFLWLNPAAIEPMVQHDGILWFDYNGQEQSVQYHPSQIIYDYTFNPLDDWRGLSPLAVALDDVNLSKFISNYFDAFFQNEARPGGILTTRNGIVLNKSDQERLMKDWEKQMKGVQNRGKTAFLPASLEWQDVQERPSLDHMELDRAAQRKICTALGVPIQLVDLDEERFQLGEEPTKIFYENTIFPRCTDILRVINEEMLPLLGDPEKEVAAFDFDSVRAMFGNQLQRSSAINSRLMSGNMTINEARRKFGDTEIEGGDIFLMPTALMPVRAEDLSKFGDLDAQIAQQAAEQAGKPSSNADQTSSRIGTNAPQENGTQREIANAQGRRLNTDAGKSADDELTDSDKAQQIELSQWQKQALHRGLKKARNFHVSYLPETVAASLRESLYALPDDAPRDAVKDAFVAARAELARLQTDIDFAELSRVLAELNFESA